ncbi:MAG: 2-aminoadipate transaminase [candidate division WS2 bacterium]|uniref:2-aminoadipate transaminase n=1 Tax=Psychracetigena formicireducens TaxID=2986056 RepID=A0A9E2BEN0_PSYF1|nr:2-aminoadipate transaminase [Candidatus Psychracetigena formicireducens]MBT9144200.1 2-aminoadipate transaminase [Candidatus Psychracetigena formicireducens]
MLGLDDFFSKRALEGYKPSAIREILKYSSDPSIISFGGGYPDPQYFPKEHFTEAMDYVLSSLTDKALQYGSTEGVKELREWLVKFEEEEEKVKLELDEIIITIGSQQGFDLLCKVLLDPGDTIIVEEPSYIGALTAFYGFQVNPVSVPMDESGIILEELENICQNLWKKNIKPKLIYVIPNFQNPAGVTLSLERRAKVLEIASKYNMLVVEDNPYGDLIYEGNKIVPIKSMDAEGRVVYLRTFSKILFPGLRLGWFMGNKSLVRKVVIAKQSSDLCTTSLGQYATYEYCRRGYLKPHIEYMATRYARKRNTMIQAIEEYFPPEVKFTRPSGGYFVWLTLPEYINADEMFWKAIEAKVAYVIGSAFHVQGRGKNTIRLSFSQIGEPLIIEGIKRLAKVITQEMEIFDKTSSAPNY